MATREISPAAPVDGRCDARFAAVRDVFAANFAEPEEVGAALCVSVDGNCVLDLWGGYQDEDRTRPWRRDTLVNVYSVGKGVLAMLVLALVERGLIELDAPVARLWPEFAANGKQDLSVRGLLSHRAGLPAIRERLPDAALHDWGRICGALAAQVPYWEPGSAHGYHVNTYGFLAGELVRRATGLPVPEALARTITRPLGAEFFWGLPRELHSRAARVVAPDVPLTEESQWAVAFPPTGDPERDRMVWHTYFNPTGFSGQGMVNTEAWRLAVIPSTNGHATARAVAAIYAAWLAGGPLGAGELRWPGPGLRAEATSIHSDGLDRVLDRPTRFGLGFQLSQPARPLGPAPGSFGHYGYGGSVGLADPEARLAFAYVLNRPASQRWYNPRTQRLIEAVYACL